MLTDKPGASHHPRLIEAPLALSRDTVPVALSAASEWGGRALLSAAGWEHMAGHMAEFRAPGFVDPAAFMF